MIVVEIGTKNTINVFENFAPFVYSALPSSFTLASYWVDDFGAADESQIKVINITALTINNRVYDRVFSLTDCVGQEHSFYFDFDNQKLFVHWDHLTVVATSKVVVGIAVGFCTERVCYIDGIEYLPLVKAIPNMGQQEDILNYRQLSYMTGTVILDNVAARLDALIATNLYGNNVDIFYLPSSKINSRDESSREFLRQIASFFVEDYTPALTSFTLNIQDKRKAHNVSFPTERFLQSDLPDLDDQYESQVIPLVFGEVREAVCTPLDGKSVSPDVRFRVAETLTALTAVYQKVDGAWLAVTPADVDLDTGTFTVEGCKTDTGGVPETKAAVVGIEHDHAPDIIKYLNNRYLGIVDNDSNYDNDEWDAEAAGISPVGVTFNTSTLIYDAIRQLQGGANIRFRYEIKGDARATIRQDNQDREISFTIDELDELNNQDLQIFHDSANLATTIEVKHSKSDQSGKFFSVVNDGNAADALDKYGQNPMMTFETLLTNAEDATDRAAFEASRLGAPSRTTELTLMGDKFLQMRIYDTVKVVLSPGMSFLQDSTILGREFYGIRKAQVLGISPDLNAILNKVKLKIVGDYGGPGILLEDGGRLLTEDLRPLLLEEGNLV